MNSYKSAFIIGVTSFFVIAGAIFFQINEVQCLLEQLFTFGHFFLLGLGGAILANATGAGGGIVFIPAFAAIGISQTEAVGTSIVIQCFGMTAGSIAWIVSFKKRPAIYQRYQGFMKTCIMSTGIASITGVLLGEYILAHRIPFSMSNTFSILSILFGLIILFISCTKMNNRHPKSQSSKLDILLWEPLNNPNIFHPHA